MQKRRQTIGLSLAAVGELVGVSAAAVSEWERGICTPTPDRQTKLADALRTTHADLFGLDQSSN